MCWGGVDDVDEDDDVDDEDDDVGDEDHDVDEDDDGDVFVLRHLSHCTMLLLMLSI